MQQQDLQIKIEQYVRKMPYIKAIILSDIEDGVEIYKYLANDIELKEENDENFVNGLRHGMTEMFTSILDQLKKLGDCNNL